MDTLLDITNIDLIIGQRQILNQVSLQLKSDEILTIIGPNGAGKTSLVRIALGLLQPTSGQVIRRPDIRIGYMPQRLHLDPTFPVTVKRFLSMVGKKQRDQVVPRLQEVGAVHVLDVQMQSLSGGELQRVLLARALMRDPDLLVLDEPVQGVDVHGQTELYQLITRIREQRQCAVMMVSHDLHLVMAATDRVICLNQHICCSGTPEAVTNDPAYLDLFGPQTVKQLAVYSHDPNHRHDNCGNCCKGGPCAR
ncbi:zinc ABC transporter ATP-binding protein ZnuC [Malonomonas rubra]|uniref:zinc ABC transporter ATP-binding protein ZnuC n=1 Tax=Malonomonas rubra TaxID=57040 RepID=UPI0026EFF5BE|nr:zinc ABC transporter ATP-binding protein ZnuC [Malonomonas rubra]